MAITNAQAVSADVRYITMDELAAILRVDRRTINRMASMSQIPGRLKLPGRLVRYNRSTVEQWLKILEHKGA